MFDPDVPHLMEIRYAGGVAIFIVDGVIRATATPGGGIDFGVLVPDTVYYGRNGDGVNQAGAVFAAP